MTKAFPGRIFGKRPAAAMACAQTHTGERRNAVARLALLFAGMGFLSSAAAHEAPRYGALPAPPAIGATSLPAVQRLELELVINGRATGHVVRVESHDRYFRLRASDLRNAGLRLAHSDDLVDIPGLDGMHADYDAPRQRLYLTVTPDYLPQQRIAGRKRKVPTASYEMGALLNYDVYVSGGDDKPRASLFHEARAFGPAGVISVTGALRSRGGPAYVRYDSVFRRSDEASATTIEVGDFVTRTLAWAPAVRLGGLQVSRDFSVRPDVVTYPLPEFRGHAALPSTVELIVGGQRIAGGPVDPGPFVLDSLPPINGYGEANLIVTDMHGRAVAQTLPFYVSSALLRPGLTDFAVALGAFRENYGIKSFDYGAVAATASARHGISDALTLEIRAEIAADTSVTGGGAVARLGTYGTLSASYSRSFGKGADGDELVVGYDYQTRRFSIGLRHSRRSRAFVDLALLDHGLRGEEYVSTATLGVSLGRAGTLGLGYFHARGEGRTDAQFANASWSLPLGTGSRLHANMSRMFDDDSWSGALTLSVPLGGRGGTLAGALLARADGQAAWRADYSRPLPVAGGIGWNAGVAGQGGDFDWRGNMGWRTGIAEMRAGAYGGGGTTAWFGASGSLIYIDDAVFAANRVSDSFVVVNTGTPAIPVRYENQHIGTTNDKGQLLIPSVAAWYAAKYEIDPLGLPASVKVGTTEQHVAIPSGGGHVVRFAVETQRPGRAILRDARGDFISAGAHASVDGAPATVVGWDGMLFLETIGSDGATQTIRVTRADGRSCTAVFVAPPQAALRGSGAIVADLGELLCRD